VQRSVGKTEGLRQLCGGNETNGRTAKRTATEAEWWKFQAWCRGAACRVLSMATSSQWPHPWPKMADTLLPVGWSVSVCGSSHTVFWCAFYDDNVRGDHRRPPAVHFLLSRSARVIFSTQPVSYRRKDYTLYSVFSNMPRSCGGVYRRAVRRVMTRNCVYTQSRFRAPRTRLMGEKIWRYHFCRPKKQQYCCHFCRCIAKRMNYLTKFSSALELRPAKVARLPLLVS